MLNLLAALMLAPVSASATPVSATPASAPLSAEPWWEKVTVTIAGDGQAEGCEYQSSIKPGASRQCAVDASDASTAGDEPGSKSEVTKITFERRFSPGSVKPPQPAMHPGDTLLSGEVMALAIDGGGKVTGCRIVARAGDSAPAYGCEEAAAEQFERHPAKAAAGGERDGFMTVLIYGHSEHIA